MAERNFQNVIESAGEGSLEFIRPSVLAEEGVKGIILEGEFVGTLQNPIDELKNDFKFSCENGATKIINSTAHLAYLMKNVNVGDFVQVKYLGKEEYKGRLGHKFEVLVDRA